MVENESPFLRAALDYIARGWSVIPLWPSKKTPATQFGLNDWSDNPEQARIWWTKNEYRGNPQYNIGIVCGQVSGGLLVIDLDAHDGANGIESLKEWESSHEPLPETVTAITGSGGKHLLYRVARTMPPSANAALGVDIRCDGSYIVAPPSIHPNRERYEWSISPDDMDPAAANDAVYAFVEYARPNHSDKFTTGGERPAFSLPETIGSGGRNDTLFRYACQLRAHGMGEEEIETLTNAANERRCQPPLPGHEVKTIVSQAMRYKRGASTARLEPDPGQKQEPVAIEPASTALVSLDTVKSAGENNGKGPTIAEMARAILDDAAVANHILFDTSARKRWKRGALPFSDDTTARQITDQDESCIWAYFMETQGWHNRQNFNDALNIVFSSSALRFNWLSTVMRSVPLVETVDPEHSIIRVTDHDGTTWEQPSMAGMLLSKWLGAEINEYNFESERLMLREIVARAMVPGCKADIMPVLYGAQGIGKSTFVRALALDERFYLPSFSTFDDEHLRRLPGILIVEVGELAAFKWKDMNAIKDALTTQVDSLRVPYAKNAERFERTCIFIGTTNSHAFLSDTTGNRRFLPVICKGKECKQGMHTGELVRDIRVAYGEILADYDRDPEGFLKSLTMPPELAKEVQAQAEAFSEENKTLNEVQDFLNGLPIGARVNVKRFYIDHCGYSATEWANVKSGDAKSVAEAFDACAGWARIGRKNLRQYGTGNAWERVE